MSFNFPALGTVVHWRIYLFIFFSPDEWLIGFMWRGRRPRITVQHCKERRLLYFPESERPFIHLPGATDSVAKREVKTTVLPAVG